MEETKAKFIEQLESFINSSVGDIESDLSALGSRRDGSYMNQYAFKGEVTLEEVCHIKPSSPKFKPGTLLTSPEGIEESDSEMAMGLKCTNDSDMDAYIDLGMVKDIYELGETRRYLKSETIMVTDESIQIRKRTVVQVADDLNKSANQISVEYTVRHILHVLDDKRKITVPTTMFKTNPESRYASDMTMRDDFDYDAVMTIYNTSTPEEIVKPLAIHKK